jgi:cytoskeleton protein RodZ
MTKVTHLTLNEGGGLSRKRIHLREISGDADLPLETVGQDLRAARLRRGDDLATASKALKIRKDHLEALEEDRFESLPGRTYAIGFVRSYANYLGLDALEAVERFKREIAGRDETPQPPAYHDGDEDRRLPHGWVVIAVVILGLVVYGAYRLARSADTLLGEPVAPVPARMTSPAEKTAPAAAAQPSAGGTTAGSAQPGPKTGETAPPAISGHLIAPEDGTQNAVAPSSSGVPETVNAPAPKGRVYGRQNTNARVVLHAVQPTRVLVEGTDGVVYISRTLRAGDSYRVPDRVGLTLTTSNAGALEVVLDGQRMGTAGRKKRMAEALSLDPQAIADRYYGRRSR